MRSLTRHLAALALVATVVAGGCSRNTPGLLLAPTGARPAPAIPTAGIWGYLVFDPTHYTSLTGAPFPPARLDLFNSQGKVVDSLFVGGPTARFEFDALPPGRYGFNVRTHAFKPATFGWYTISTRVQDVGNLGLVASIDSLASAMYVIGNMTGFTTAELYTYTTFMDQNDLGVWTYPGTWGSTPVPAGTHRFKFVTDASSTPNHLIGWGGDSTQVLTAPVIDAPVRFGTGPVSDLKVSFPTSGTYLFTFDERRLTFSVVAGPAPLRAPGTASWRKR